MYSGTAAKILDALASYDLKPDGDRRFRSNSPFRPGSNSHAFTLNIDDDEHGAYFDHVSQESGSLYELARALGIDVSGGVTVASTKRAYAGIEDYAAAHGITADVLRKAGWHETIYQGRPALAFKTATGTRWRFLDEKKPHYTSPKGYQRSWYGLNPSTAKKLADGHDLVICNGEISTVVARHYGLAAAAITGGEKGIPADLLEELKTFLGGVNDAPPIIVAMDCDDAGRRAARLVTRQLREAGFIAKPVDLQLSKGGDLADFCLLHGNGARKQLPMQPVLTLDEPDPQVHSRGWYIIPAAELKNLPPIEWIVPGEIPARGITVLFGASGAGKSFIALDYALRIAQKQPVLYMAGEGEYGYQQRVAAWCNHHKLNEGKLYMCLGAVQLLETGDLDAFLEANAAIKPVLVVIDTMARSMVGSDENSTRDMGLFVQACETVKKTLDTAVLIIHHTNKGGVHERGNSALRGSSDVMIRATAEDDIIRIESAKTKDAQPFPTRYIQLVTVPVEIDGETVESAVIIDADRVFQTADDPLTLNQMKVLRLLVDEQYGASRNEISETTGVPYHSLQRILSQLLKLEYVEVEGYGKPYKATKAGLDRLDRLDRAFSDSDENDQEKITRSSRSTDQLREEVDRLDRSTSETSTDSNENNPDQAAVSVQSGDQVDQLQPRLIGADSSNYYEAGL